MKRAYCSGCGKYVVLDESGMCPGGHPRPCYRDISDVDPQAGAPLPLASDARGPVVPPSGAAAGRTSRPWVWILAAVAGVLLLAAIGIGIGVGALAHLRSAASAQNTPPASAPSTSTPAQDAAPASEPKAAEHPQPAADGSYPPLLVKDAAYVRPTYEQQLWALATFGILTQANGERHDLLGERTSADIAAVKQMLSGSWGIESRDDLLDTLVWIEQGGHRQEFDTIAWELSSLSSEQLADVRSQAAGDPALANEIDIVEKNAAQLGSKSIAGWDFSRYVYLCRCGYLVGYLTEDEMWQKIMPAARLMQATFSSWSDLGDNYLIGRKFWTLDEQSNAAMSKAERTLLNDPDSPWVSLPWKLDLSSPS